MSGHGRASFFFLPERPDDVPALKLPKVGANSVTGVTLLPKSNRPRTQGGKAVGVAETISGHRDMVA
jgi:hypothetical protein